MQKQYKSPSLGHKRNKKRKKSAIGGQFTPLTVIICLAILCVFVVIAVVSRNGGGFIAVSGPAFDGRVTVCVDPGHGYDDPGALSDYIGDRAEKDINLKAALMLTEKLEELGYEVIMTRDSDTVPASMEPDERGLYTLGPNDRTAWLAEQDCDLFVSLHCNVAENKPHVVGTQIYYCSGAVAQSKDYAKALERAMGRDFPDRSVAAINTRVDDSFAVIRDISIPGVLVEMGFISSPDDSLLLLDQGWLDRFCSSLANAVSAYISENSR